LIQIYSFNQAHLVGISPIKCVIILCKLWYYFL